MNIPSYMLLTMAALCAGGAARAEVAFLAYGDLRGYFEPCGCDPATDMGGVLRINSQIRRERMSQPNVAVFNLGNMLSEKKRDVLKNSYLLKADVVTQPAAYLMNELEIKLSDQLHGVQLPFVLSNAKTLQGLPFKESREISSAFIYGYTFRDELANKVRRLSPEMLNDWKKAVTKHRPKPAVLLFSGPDGDLKQIQAAGIFETIISSNTKPLSVEPGKDEAENESLLQRMSGDSPVYMVPAGGQGILRGGAMTKEEAKPVAAYLLPDKKQTEFSSPGLTFTKPVRVTWLKKDKETGHALAELYAEYTAAVTAAFQESSKSRLAALATSPFAGDAACASCHQNQHAVYKKSAHAHAMQTLIDKNKHQDPECVACHTVGAEVKGGFVSVKDSPHLANVQCENCHGPRKEHAQNPTIKPEAAKGEAMCVSCHNAQHSPRFEFASYWEKIKH